jgi:nucleoid-associated protein YgaU
VETGQDGNFFASGAAAPGARLRLYLNNAPIASVTADISGAWSLRVEHGLKPGSYEVRADAISPADGSVLARAAAPFVFQGFAGARASDRSKVAKAGPSAGAAVVSIATVEVARGDNLWRISRHILGRGMRYTLIYEANASQIRDRNLIYPGQIFVIPKS